MPFFKNRDHATLFSSEQMEGNKQESIEVYIGSVAQNCILPQRQHQALMVEIISMEWYLLHI